MKTLIQNAMTVLPDTIERTSILIEDGKIAVIDPAPQTRHDESVNAEGMFLMPGVIDDQVHFRDPGLTHKEDLYTATRACAKGGVTTFLEMPNTNPTTTSVEALHAKLELASGKCLVNYGFYVGATSENTPELIKAQRTPGIKIFIGSSTGNLLVDEQEALERIFAETTLPICAHCEDETVIRENQEKFKGITDVSVHSKIRDEEAAARSTLRTFDLAVRHKHRFHLLHVSTGVETRLLGTHHNLLTAEVCPHHLFFNTDDYERLGSLVQMYPSVKGRGDNEQLWRALLDGKVQVIATDHAPHTLEEKQQPYPKSPSGVPAVENSLALMLNQVNHERCRMRDVVNWMCDAPARVWDIVDKGRIQEGYDADLVLVDMARTATIRNAEQETKCKWSPWDGTELQGWPVRTWVMGQEVFRAGEIDETVNGHEAKFDHARGGYWATQ